MGITLRKAFIGRGLVGGLLGRVCLGKAGLVDTINGD